MVRSSVCAALAVMFAAVGCAHAMTLSAGDTNIVELMEQSSDIVLGHVRSVTDGIDERGIPYTEVTLTISESIRGNRTEEYKFRQFGLLTARLTPDGKRKMMPAPPGFPKYVADEEVVLFLRPAAIWTGFRMPAGVTQGKFTIAAGRAENGMSNAGLFRNVGLDQSVMNELDKRLLTTASGPVNPDAFLSFVRRAVKDRWVETGRMTRANRPGSPTSPPASEPVDLNDEPSSAAAPPAPNPGSALLDPNANVLLPRGSR